MSKKRVRIHLRAQLQSALHIAGPGRTVALVDRPMELDAQGFPMIPASSVRGRIRVHLERLLKAWGEPVCIPPVPEQMCPHYWKKTKKEKNVRTPPDHTCLACHIFGSTWYEASIVSNDLYLNESQRVHPDLLRIERMSLGMSRRLGTAQSERLFATETTTPDLDSQALTFEGNMVGRLSDAELGWLLAAIRLVVHAGGGKARGLGALQLEAIDVEGWQNGDWAAIASPNHLIEEVLTDDTQ